MKKKRKKKRIRAEDRYSSFERLMVKQANEEFYKKYPPKNKKRVFTSYREYILSNQWKRKRRRILKRAKGICEKCKVMKAKHVHHKHYRTLYNEKDKDLIALCGVCHATIHNKMTDEQLDTLTDKIMLNNYPFRSV